MSAEIAGYLKRLLRESITAMEDLQHASPDLSDEAFVFGAWEYFALGVTVTISQANVKGFKPNAVDALTEQLVREAVPLLVSSADVTPDRQAFVEPTVRDLLITRGREYFNTDPASFTKSLANTFARNVAQTCGLRKTAELGIATTVSLFVKRIGATEFLESLKR